MPKRPPLSPSQLCPPRPDLPAPWRPNRRALLGGFAAALLTPASAAPRDPVVLRARPLPPQDKPPQDKPPQDKAAPLWALGDTVPGPLLRLHQGETLQVRLINDLPEPMALHWHGVRLPNAFDGVPGLTQAAVPPGGTFDCSFAPPDAGTFWYHAAERTPGAPGAGLFGLLVVDERSPAVVDQDIALALTAHGPDRARNVGLNGRDYLNVPVRQRERLRLRLVNTTVDAALVFQIGGHDLRVMAIDGQPAQPFLARGGRIALSPGNRVDVLVEAGAAPGSEAEILLEPAGGTSFVCGRLIYAATPAGRPPRLDEILAFPNNQLPEQINLRNALRINLPVNGFTTRLNAAPAFTAARGRPVVLAVDNPTATAMTLHLHGHAMRLLDRLDDGWKPFWLDTLTIPSRQTVRLAFVADNPGRWLIETQPLGPEGGPRMINWFAVG